MFLIILKDFFMNQTIEKQKIPTGEVKTFGHEGVAYVVGEPIQALPDGDILVQIELLYSGENTEYRLSKLLQDPKAV